MLAAVALVTNLVADSSPICGSSALARARLEETVSRFTPGMTFDEVRVQIQAPNVPAEFWGTPPRHEMGPWLLVGRDATRVAQHALVCDFDGHDRLVTCKSWLGLREMQEIEESAYATVQKGDAVHSVLSRLCEPGVKEQRKDGTLVFTYWVPRPSAEYCPVYLVFRKGRLIKKEMKCM